jgi:hypothetical protein
MVMLGLLGDPCKELQALRSRRTNTGIIRNLGFIETSWKENQ